MDQREMDRALDECAALRAIFESIQLQSETALERVEVIEAGLRADNISRNFQVVMEGLRGPETRRLPMNVS
jgi:hypothetical protein